ncbi:MAG: radical SAM family heme chaperone HemW [Chloroflexota bacterium]
MDRKTPDLKRSVNIHPQTDKFNSLLTTNPSKLISLYLHIPFCRYRCSYCDFNTYTTIGDLQEAYAVGLHQEVSSVLKGQDRQLSTLFFGGGTPSLMTIPQLDHILSAVWQHVSIPSDFEPEITLEANPETVSLDYLRQLREIGINRISFGAQSAQTGDLNVLGREHSFETVIEAVGLARAAGIDNLSIDLIYGVPHQSLEAWQKTVEVSLALDLPHYSFYCLTVEPGTALHRQVNSLQVPSPDPDLAADQYDLASELMTQAGHEHYEISNWSKPGFQSQHNLAYWYNDEYLGLGAGAHGHANGVRYHVVKQPRVYLRRMATGEELTYPLSAAVAGHERLPAEDEMFDTVMMGLRLLIEGLSDTRFTARFGRSLEDVYGEVIQGLLEEELVEWAISNANRALRLTPQGRFVSNQVFHRFL